MQEMTGMYYDSLNTVLQRTDTLQQKRNNDKDD